MELRKDLDESDIPFSPPVNSLSMTKMESYSKKIREWLNAKDKSFEFKDWRQKLENVGVFVLVTSSFKNWTTINPASFRGLSIYYNNLPIIIINGSDHYKARSFTLFHELGHLLKKDTMFDTSIGDQDNEEEKLCDHFAGEVLMPRNQVSSFFNHKSIFSLSDIEHFSKKFKVSLYASLVRLKKLNYLDKNQYNQFFGSISSSIKRKKQKSKENKLFRNIPNETKTQYGNIYLNTIMQAYYYKEITLYKARNMLGLNKTEHLLKILEKTPS